MLNTLADRPRTTLKQAPQRTDLPLAVELNAEWQRTCDNATTNQICARWAQQAPALAELPSLESILTAGREATGTVSDRLLLALLELAGDGDRLAARVVLQMMLPKAIRIADSVSRQQDCADRDGVLSAAVAALWNTICSYPCHRRRERVAANLAMETLHELRGRRQPRSIETPTDFTEPLFDRADGLLPTTTNAEGPTVADAQLFELLRAASQLRVISDDEARLLALVYNPDTWYRPASKRQVARDFGISDEVLRQRCRRAIAKLASWATRDPSVYQDYCAA